MTNYRIDIRNELNALTDIYRPTNPLSASSIALYEAALSGYSTEQVRMAIGKYLESNATYFPSPGKLIEIIAGPKPDPSELIGMARAANCPLGILARIYIGTFDLNNANDFYLKDRAEEFLCGFEQIVKRASAGDYTDHELAIMAKHGVNPAMGLVSGFPPTREVRQSLSARLSSLKALEKPVGHSNHLPATIALGADKKSNREEYAKEQIPEQVSAALKKFMEQPGEREIDEAIRENNKRDEAKHRLEYAKRKLTN